MKLSVFAIFVFLLTTSFKFGSGTAYLTCTSESGRTLFNAEIEDFENGLQSAELIVDGKKLAFTQSDNSYSIFDAHSGVYTIFLESKSNGNSDHYKFLKFWSVPSTFKTIINTSSHQKYEFKAKLYATEPRKGKELQTPTVEVKCSLEYEI